VFSRERFERLGCILDRDRLPDVSIRRCRFATRRDVSVNRPSKCSRSEMPPPAAPTSGQSRAGQSVPSICQAAAAGDDWAPASHHARVRPDLPAMRTASAIFLGVCVRLGRRAMSGTLEQSARSGVSEASRQGHSSPLELRASIILSIVSLPIVFT
jgi:hypothetical protein